MSRAKTLLLFRLRGENRTIEVAKFETEKDAFNFEAWRRHIIEQEAVKASGQAFEVCADQEDAEEVEGHEIEVSELSQAQVDR